LELVGRIAVLGAIRMGNVLVGKPEGRKPLGRLRNKWEGNI
jgi:hypothetical protein